MRKKTIVYIGNGIGEALEEAFTNSDFTFIRLKDIRHLVESERMDLIVADDSMQKCFHGEEVKCTMDDVVVLRNRFFPGVPLLIYTSDPYIGRYYTNHGYQVLNKSADLKTLRARVIAMLRGGRT